MTSSINAYMQGIALEKDLQIGEPDEDGLRTFQGRAGLGAMRTTSYWLTVILATLVEAYTKDILTFVASRRADRDVLRGPVRPYDGIVGVGCLTSA